MAGSFTDYWENRVLNHLFSNEVYLAPSIYVALSTTDPTESGADITEPSGNGYARVLHSSWNTAEEGFGEVTNNGAVTYAAATGSWGTVTHFALFDSLTGGEALAYGTLATSKAVTNGDTIKFNDTSLTVSLD